MLAGGESSRMGTDKAFLYHEGRPFVSAIAAELAKACSEVVVMIGRKRREDFVAVLDERVKVFNDDSYLANPLGGILSGLGHTKHSHVAMVGCDTPLIRAEVISYLFGALGDRSAAIPVWEEGDVGTAEPLCAVYKVSELKSAVQKALKDERPTVKYMVSHIRDVLYVDVSQIRLVDPLLGCFLNVNTKEEYAALQKRAESSSQSYPWFSKET